MHEGTWLFGELPFPLRVHIFPYIYICYLSIKTTRPTLLDLCAHADDVIAIFSDPYYSLM